MMSLQTTSTAAVLLALAAGAAEAQLEAPLRAQPEPTLRTQPEPTLRVEPDLPLRATLELLGAHSHLNAGLPQGRAANARGTWVFGNGDVARAEVLDETKFDSHGGIVAAGYTRVLTPDWILAGTLAAGHGGPNWANQRADVELSTKWGEGGWVLTRAALYHARFDAGRSDQGLRLSAVVYLPASVVLEGGVIANRSQPGGVRSDMWFASGTWGTEGLQYASLRASSGSEAYQAIGAGSQLVDFRSRSLALSWRYWLGRPWGFIAQAEHYRNPFYMRNTLGVGLFVQW